MNQLNLFREKESSKINYRVPLSFKVNVLAIKLVGYEGNLRAYVNAEIWANDVLVMVVRGVRIVQEENKAAWAQWPHQQSKRDGRWYPIILKANPDLDRLMKDACLKGYNEKRSA